MNVTEPAAITGYHAHVYFEPASRSVAERVREELARRFEIQLGRWREEPVGPHPRAMFQVAFKPDQFASVVPWLMLNREGLSILVHPETGDDVGDHAERPLWLGERLALNIDFLRRLRDRPDTPTG